MISSSSSYRGSACSPGSSCVKRGSGLNPFTPTFASFGRYADVGTEMIEGSHPGLRLHVGSSSTLSIEKGILLGMDITYLSQVWNVWDAESTQAFYEEVLPYIHPETLRPLMGTCVPTVIGLYGSATGRLSLAMELTHPVGWREADPHISAELKQKVITAYRNIHRQGILHNDVKLENMLIGNDDEVTIVDFCKMVVNSEPADLVLEMRVVEFILDYDRAKETEYERLRRAELRVEKNLWRSRLRRAAESQELTEEVSPDEPPSHDEIAFPPFRSRCLMMWDSEVASEGTTHHPGWRGKRFEVPEDMRNPPWPGVKDYIPPTPPPYQPIDFAGLVKSAFGRKPFGSHSQWMQHCRYFPYLWSPPPEPTVSGLKHSVGTSSSSITSSGSSDYGGASEHSSTTNTEPSKRDRSPTPPFLRKRLRTEEFIRPDDYSYRNKRTRRSKSLEDVVEHEVDLASWATLPVGGLGSPLSVSKSKGKERGSPRLVASPREVSAPEIGLPTLTNLSPGPRKFSASCSRRLGPMTRPHRSSARTLVTTSPRPKSERKCSVVVKDGDEDKVWLMSEEALQDVKGYLQVKKAAGAAVEVYLGGAEGGVRHSQPRVERVLRSPSARPARKRSSSPEGSNEEAQKPKRRRSWPAINPHESKHLTDSLLCSD